MNDTSVVEIAVHAMLLTAKVTGPFLAMSLTVGFAVSLFQSVTQVQEVTLTFVPKLLGVGGVLAVGGHWMLGELVGFTTQLFDLIPELVKAS
jgi:flagellar biosynthetic protein FliQ